MIMRKNGFVLFLIFMVLFGGFSFAIAAPPPASEFFVSLFLRLYSFPASIVV